MQSAPATTVRPVPVEAGTVTNQPADDAPASGRLEAMAGPLAAVLFVVAPLLHIAMEGSGTALAVSHVVWFLDVVAIALLAVRSGQSGARTGLAISLGSILVIEGLAGNAHHDGDTLGAGAVLLLVLVVGVVSLTVGWLTQRFSAADNAMQVAESAGGVLRQTELRHQALVEQLPGVYYTTSSDSIDTLLTVGPGLTSLTGFSEQEATAEPRFWLGRIHADDRVRVVAELQRALVSGDNFQAEYRVLARDGRALWVRDESRVVRDADGTALCRQGIWTDITRQRRADLELRETQRRGAAILNGSIDGLIVIDHHGHILEFNPAAQQMFGFRREDVIGKEIGDAIVPPAFRASHRAGLARHVATGEARILGQRVEINAMRADGSEFPVELTVTRMDESNPPRFLGSIRDTSDRKRAEEEVRRSEARFRALVENGLDIITVVNRDGTITYETPSVKRVLGIDAAESAGGRVIDRVHSADRERAERFFSQALAIAGQHGPTDLRFTHRDGTVRVLEVIATNRLYDNSAEGVVINARDVTDRRRLEERRGMAA